MDCIVHGGHKEVGMTEWLSLHFPLKKKLIYKKAMIFCFSKNKGVITLWTPLSNIAAAAAAAKSLQSCPTLCDPIDGQPTRLRHPWDSPGKNTGMGCHFLLQCMKVKSQSEVAQLCPTLRNPMDCSLPGSSVHGIFQARVLEWGAIA